MYEKEIKLTDMSFIFLRKLASRECVLRGPKMLKINFVGVWQAVPCRRLYGPGFLDCWAVGPLVKNSKMITDRPVEQYRDIMALLLNNFCRIFVLRSEGPLLTHYQTSNFRLFQTERFCRKQFQF